MEQTSDIYTVILHVQRINAAVSARAHLWGGHVSYFQCIIVSAQVCVCWLWSVCRYFLHGVCREGSRCMFSHDLASSKPSTICKYYQRGVCAYGERCRWVMMTSLGSESQLDIKHVCVFVLKHAWSYNIRHGAQIILYISSWWSNYDFFYYY